MTDPGDESAWVPSDDLDIVSTDFADFDELELRTASAAALGVTYLSSASADAACFPVHGIVFGPLSRVLVNLVVSQRAARRAINVLFLVNTGSPHTYCSPAVYAALGVTDSLPKALVLNVHGVELSVSPSHGNFTDVNVLGQDFFSTGGVNVAFMNSRQEQKVILMRPRRRGG